GRAVAVARAGAAAHAGVGRAPGPHAQPVGAAIRRPGEQRERPDRAVGALGQRPDRRRALAAEALRVGVELAGLAGRAVRVEHARLADDAEPEAVAGVHREGAALHAGGGRAIVDGRAGAGALALEADRVAGLAGLDGLGRKVIAARVARQAHAGPRRDAAQGD